MDSGVSPNEPVGERFERLYEEWFSYVTGSVISYSSSESDYIQNPQFDAIVNLGSGALPFIMEKLRSDEHAHFLIHALPKLTGKHFSPEELETYRPLADGPLGNQALVQLWLSWWDSQKRHINGSRLD